VVRVGMAAIALLFSPTCGEATLRMTAKVMVPVGVAAWHWYSPSSLLCTPIIYKGKGSRSDGTETDESSLQSQITSRSNSRNMEESCAGWSNSPGLHF
jgi:hypothetical protein